METINKNDKQTQQIELTQEDIETLINIVRDMVKDIENINEQLQNKTTLYIADTEEGLIASSEDEWIIDYVERKINEIDIEIETMFKLKGSLVDCPFCGMKHFITKKNVYDLLDIPGEERVFEVRTYYNDLQKSTLECHEIEVKDSMERYVLETLPNKDIETRRIIAAIVVKTLIKYDKILNP